MVKGTSQILLVVVRLFFVVIALQWLELNFPSRLEIIVRWSKHDVNEIAVPNYSDIFFIYYALP